MSAASIFEAKKFSNNSPIAFYALLDGGDDGMGGVVQAVLDYQQVVVDAIQRQDFSQVGGDFLTALTHNFLKNSPEHENREQADALISNDPKLYPFGGWQARTKWLQSQNRELIPTFEQYIKTLPPTKFLGILSSTRRPNVVAENALVLGDNWNAPELDLLSRITLVVPNCTVYGSGGRGRDCSKRHKNPFQATMVYLSGHLFASELDRTPDLQAMTTRKKVIGQPDHDEINFTAFYQGYKEKLLPALKLLQQQAAQTKKRVLFVLPAFGTGYFAGKFAPDTLKKYYLEPAFRRLMREQGGNFSQVDVVVDFWDDDRQTYYEDFSHGDKSSNRLYTFSSKSKRFGPLSTLDDYTNLLQNASSSDPFNFLKSSPDINFNQTHTFAAAVAADTIALPGAELSTAETRQQEPDTVIDNTVARDHYTASDDPAKTRDCDSLEKISGLPGSYLLAQPGERIPGAFRPLVHNSWSEAIRQNRYIFRPDNNFAVANAQGNFINLPKQNNQSGPRDTKTSAKTPASRYSQYNQAQSNCRAYYLYQTVGEGLNRVLTAQLPHIFAGPVPVNAESGYTWIEAAALKIKSPTDEKQPLNHITWPEVWNWAKGATKTHSAAKTAADIADTIKRIFNKNAASVFQNPNVQSKVLGTIRAILKTEPTTQQYDLLYSYFQFFNAGDSAWTKGKRQEVQTALQKLTTLNSVEEIDKLREDLENSIKPSESKTATTNEFQPKPAYTSLYPPAQLNATLYITQDKQLALAFLDQQALNDFKAHVGLDGISVQEDKELRLRFTDLGAMHRFLTYFQLTADLDQAYMIDAEGAGHHYAKGNSGITLLLPKNSSSNPLLSFSPNIQDPGEYLDFRKDKITRGKFNQGSFQFTEIIPKTVITPKKEEGNANEMKHLANPPEKFSPAPTTPEHEDILKPLLPEQPAHTSSSDKKPAEPIVEQNNLCQKAISFFTPRPAIQDAAAIGAIASGSAGAFSILILMALDIGGYKAGWDYLSRVPDFDHANTLDILTSSSVVYPVAFVLLSIAAGLLAYKYLPSKENKIADQTPENPLLQQQAASPELGAI